MPGKTKKIRKDQGADRNSRSLNLKAIGDASTSKILVANEI